ncbi:DUF6891 domain-containing protein [Actinoplanes solisilvae]|uniref:DUF6891 domain-containing protein n=1 Tax=Actinoplanes solisilvae TaxID=2486853 RepID=UPI000FD74B86|nr:hypothetical protein [Actinoplanes solisilvae]
MSEDDLRESATATVRVEVARGGATCAEIVTQVLELLESEAGDASKTGDASNETPGEGQGDRAGRGDGVDLTALAWEVVAAEFAAHLEKQAGWPERTDSDRLTAAFHSLDAAGIVAREDFSCCQNCGVTEIRDETTDGASRGYVFYHGQDALSAAEGLDIWLAYGGRDAEQIAHEIVEALRAEGLTVQWDGTVGLRIHVTLRWARRRHGRMAAFPAPGDATGPTATIRYSPGRNRLDPPMTAALLARLELPWLPAGVSVRVEEAGRVVTVHRERDTLIAHDGRRAGRFDGLRLLRGETVDVEGEPGLVEVGTDSSHPRPMDLPEMLDVLRRLPVRTSAHLTAAGEAGVVQMCWEEDRRLWLETPRAADAASIGKHATLDEAERVLTILAVEHRNAVGELNGVITRPW